MGLLVKDLMTEDVETLYLGESLNLAETIMRLGRIRHLPVVDGEGTVVGLVTHRDLLRAQASCLESASNGETAAEEVPIDRIMRKEVLTVRADTLAAEAGEILQEHKFGCLPVVAEDNHLVGILTEADFVSLALKHLASDAD